MGTTITTQTSRKVAQNDPKCQKVQITQIRTWWSEGTVFKIKSTIEIRPSNNLILLEGVSLSWGRKIGFKKHENKRIRYKDIVH